MKTKFQKKSFDSVKMMREIRNNLSQIYFDNPELEIKDLKDIRKKYGIKSKDLTYTDVVI